MSNAEKARRTSRRALPIFIVNKKSRAAVVGHDQQRRHGILEDVLLLVHD